MQTCVAADLAARPYTKAPPPMVAAVYDWTGFYIGANGGLGSSRKCWSDITALAVAEGTQPEHAARVGGAEAQVSLCSSSCNLSAVCSGAR